MVYGHVQMLAAAQLVILLRIAALHLALLYSHLHLVHWAAAGGQGLKATPGVNGLRPCWRTLAV